MQRQTQPSFFKAANLRVAAAVCKDRHNLLSSKLLTYSCCFCAKMDTNISIPLIQLLCCVLVMYNIFDGVPVLFCRWVVCTIS